LANSCHHIINDIFCLRSNNENNEIFRELVKNISGDRIIKTELNGIINFLSPIILFCDKNAQTEELKFILNTLKELQAWRVIVVVERTKKSNLELYELFSKYEISDLIFCTDGFEYMDRIKNHLVRWDKIDNILKSDLIKNSLVGKSKIWIKLLNDIIESAMFSDLPVLITGESGTGKELIANLIHSIYSTSGNSDDLIVVDCTNLSKELAGSELFGHEKGSFTNAIYTRDGAVALADNGTLFLDEIGELPKDLQSMLLRVLQEGKYKRIGSSIWRSSYFRLISATSRDLDEELKKGNFREDLYYRITGSIFRAPSLKERREDIPLLINHFLCEFLKVEEPPPLDTITKEYLLCREYPGNVRELEQLVKRIACKYIGPGNINICDAFITEKREIPVEQGIYHIPTFDTEIRKMLNNGASMQDIKNKIVNTTIRIALEETNGVVTEAAKKLQITKRLIQLRNHGNEKFGQIN
jgi:transcriptional regulator with GAF, ATPase, and Fis domain